jgi:hypothetical protein
MTNKHIEVVKKWLVDKESVSHEELRANAKTAAYTTAYAAYSAAAYAAAALDVDAAYWVKKYEELTNDK